MTALLETPLRPRSYRAAPVRPARAVRPLRLAEPLDRPAAYPAQPLDPPAARPAAPLAALGPIVPLVRPAGGIPAALRAQRSVLAYPARSATRPRPAPMPLRFTRRARLLALLLAGLGLCAVLALALVNATPDGNGLADAPSSVLVGPGDTLWQIATEIAPGQDPLTVIGRIRAANGLGSAPLHPGQLLSIPRG